MRTRGKVYPWQIRNVFFGSSWHGPQRYAKVAVGLHRRTDHSGNRLGFRIARSPVQRAVR